MTSSLAQDRLDVLETCRNAPQFVPVIHHGLLMAINRRRLDTIMPGPDITAEDYVVGLELLGERFWTIRDPNDRLAVLHSVAVPLPEEHREAWERRADHLRAAWTDRRNSEILAYLLERDGPPRPEFVTIDGEQTLDLRGRAASQGAPDHAA